mgnify:CR=1 FL=1
MTYQEEFITFMVRAGVLTFGDFTTKSGRRTPYFINTGNYKTAPRPPSWATTTPPASSRTSPTGGLPLRPRYKGIPLAVSAAASLYRNYGRDLPTASTARRPRITARAASWWAASPRTATGW